MNNDTKEEDGGERVSGMKKKRDRSFFVIFVLVILLVSAIGAAGYFYHQYRTINMTKSDQQEVDALVSTIGKSMDLPTDEVPTIATITDKTKLAEQPFFKKAENGDKILIYSKAGRAILYRPSIQKIVDVTAINVSDTTTEKVPSQPTDESSQPVAEVPSNPDGGEMMPPTMPIETATPSIALYNGTSKLGLTQKEEATIVKAFPQVTILEKETANNVAYQKTVVVNVSGTYSDIAENLAKKYQAEVISLPAGERETKADILIIFGADQL